MQMLISSVDAAADAAFTKMPRIVCLPGSIQNFLSFLLVFRFLAKKKKCHFNNFMSHVSFPLKVPSPQEHESVAMTRLAREHIRSSINKGPATMVGLDKLDELRKVQIQPRSDCVSRV